MRVTDISLIDIFKRYTNRTDDEFKQEGKRYLTNCHAHKDSDPSLNLYDKTDKGLGWDFHCFACGAHGNSLDLLVQLGVAEDKSKAEEILMRDFGLKFPDKVTLEHFCKYKGIDMNFAFAEGWQDCDEGMMINFYDEHGTIISRKIRTKYKGKNKYYFIQKEGYKNNSLYGLNWLNDYPEDVIYITEGETDAMTLKQSGFPVLGVPSTNAWNSGYAHYLEKFKKIVVVRDNDDAGEQLLEDLEKDFKNNLYIKVFPKTIKDINDFHIYQCGCNIEDFKVKFVALKVIPATTNTFIQAVKEDESIIKDLTSWQFATRKITNPLDKADFINSLAEVSSYGKRELNAMMNHVQTEVKQLQEWYKQTKNGITLDPYKYANYIANNFPICKVDGNWFMYENGVYRMVEDAYINSIITENLIPECKDEPKNVRDTFFYLDNNIKLFKQNSEFDKDPYIMNLKNGLLNIATMELTPHTPEYLSMLQLNVEYDPNNTDYTLLQKYLNDKIPDKANQLLAQEILGYAISSFNDAEKWFLLIGDGRSGKGTFLNIIEHVLGKDYVSNVPLQDLGQRFKTASLYGKLANVEADLPISPIKEHSIAVLKSCIGRDGIFAEFKGKDGFKFVNKATMIFGCNGLPQNVGDNKYSSFWSKLIILPMQHSDVVNVDVTFKYRLIHQKESLNAVFLWALEGLKRLIANDFQFTTTEESLRLKKAYREESSNVIRFALECCEVGKPEHGFYVLSEEFMKAYQQWCKIDGSQAKRSDNVVKELHDFFLTEQGVEIKKERKRFGSHSNARMYFIGIRIVDDLNGYSEF